jgi:hypothetical protein
MSVGAGDHLGPECQLSPTAFHPKDVVIFSWEEHHVPVPTSYGMVLIGQSFNHDI